LASIREKTTALAISPRMTNSKAQTSSPIPSPDHFSWRVGEGCGVKDSEVVRCALDVNVDVGVVLALGVRVAIGVGSGK
jgi:hypothetical protein